MKNNNNKSHPKCIVLALAVSLTACNGGTPDDENGTIVSVQSGADSNSQCTGTANPNNITDVILATGQSNLIGPDTAVSATLDNFGKVVEFHQPDRPHPYVFAWTIDPENNNAGLGWQIADLTQSWHDTNPGVGGIARNNFAFHFAKQVADRSSTCRIIGIVMVAEGGKGISHWDYDQPGWAQVERHVGEALSAIGKQSLDGILWHQGESDWIEDGTCFPDDICINGAPDYYAQKLFTKIADPQIRNPYGNSALINRLRRQSWFGEHKPFIAAETLKAPVNVHLNKLNDDRDYWTATVRGDIASGLGINDLDPFRNHYSAAGLRKLGARYATEYITMRSY